MGDGRLGVVVEGGPGRDVVDAGGAGARVALVAPDLVGVDVRHGTVALEVGRDAHIFPVRSVGNAREGVLLL